MKPAELRELGVVKTASPCARRWEDMSGDDVKRYCADCKLHVWNFAALTSDEARALLIETHGRLCARIFTRADGTVLTRDCPRGMARLKRRALAPLVAVVAWVIAAGATVIGLFSRQGASCSRGRWSQAVLEAVRSAPHAPATVAPAPLQSANLRDAEMMGELSF